jgi:group I intron endonuclease
MFIYVIVCNETLKIYVGQHKGDDLGKYLSRKFWDANHHTSGTRSHIYASMRKHPRESWSIHPLVSDIADRKELDELEKHFIQVLKTQHPEVGYNICDGGEGFTGPHTEEWRRETLARVQAYWEKPEGHIRISHHMTERWLDPKFRQMMTERSAGNKYRSGKSHSEETRAKISIANKGMKARLGQKRSPEEITKGLESRAQTRSGYTVEQIADEHSALDRARHTRWHVNRGVLNSNCSLCDSKLTKV